MAAPPKIRALLCLQNGAESYATEVETVQTIPDETTALVGYNTASKVFLKENLHAYAVWNNDDKSQPGFKLTPLPDIQPECPIMYVDERAWNGRVVFGNADFHMFFVPVAREEGFSIEGPDRCLPLAGDAVIMKVLPDRDPTHRRKYERVDPSCQLFEQLKSFLKEVKDIMEKSGFNKSRGYIK